MYITLPEVTSYLDGLYRPLSQELGELRQAAEQDGVPIILKDTEALLLNCLRLRQPKRILEIGTAVGYSALCFATLSPEISVTTLEKKEEMVRTAEENIRRFGLEQRIQVIGGDARETLKSLEQSIEQSCGDDSKAERGYDLVFIDAAKAQYRVFWDEAVTLLSKRAVVISDNVLFKAMIATDEFGDRKKNGTIVRRMREYLAYITNLNGVQTAVLPVGDGVAISCFDESWHYG